MRLAKQIPPQIYLQAHDAEGNLLDATKDEVTWCVDRINENDTVYILATPELAVLLDLLAACAYTVAADYEGLPEYQSVAGNARRARETAASIREALAQEDK